MDPHAGCLPLFSAKALLTFPEAVVGADAIDVEPAKFLVLPGADLGAVPLA
jgi:hypothetical protein